MNFKDRIIFSEIPSKCRIQNHMEVLLNCFANDVATGRRLRHSPLSTYYTGFKAHVDVHGTATAYSFCVFAGMAVAVYGRSIWSELFSPLSLGLHVRKCESRI